MIGSGRAHFGCVLCRFPIHDLAVVALTSATQPFVLVSAEMSRASAQLNYSAISWASPPGIRCFDLADAFSAKEWLWCDKTAASGRQTTSGRSPEVEELVNSKPGPNLLTFRSSRPGTWALIRRAMRIDCVVSLLFYVFWPAWLRCRLFPKMPRVPDRAFRIR